MYGGGEETRLMDGLAGGRREAEDSNRRSWVVGGIEETTFADDRPGRLRLGWDMSSRKDPG